jgi:hypothetical protein
MNGQSDQVGAYRACRATHGKYETMERPAFVMSPVILHLDLDSLVRARLGTH